MIIALRRLTIAGALLSLVSFAAIASAQSDTAPLTPLQRQLSHIDFGISGMGDFTKDTSGPNDLNGYKLTDAPGSTLGALATIRYTKSPYVGFEFNYTYNRFVQNFSGTQVNPPVAPSTTNTLSPYTLGVQTTVSEFSGGYVAHTPKVFGIGTFVAVGAGSTEFRPTRGGGQSFLAQARATYYYNVGLETPIVNSHFGLRLGFRQAYFLAPDFETNYLRNHQRTDTTEPNFGFYIHF
jgi:hypothetical protein